MSSFAKRIAEMETEAYHLKVLTDPLGQDGIIAFAAGSPAKEAYPFDQIREIADEVFQPGAKGYAAMKYGSDYGYNPLREAVRDELLAPAGLHADLKNIMITAGGIQPMNMIGALYLDPGDVVLVETPSFVQTSMIFKMFEAKLVPCAMDNDGLLMDDVEAKILQYHPKMIYTNPTFQNPTGKTLCLERRKKLVELAEKYDVIILEDDPYREIRYSGEDLPYIKSFDTTDHVILSNSFSKIFSPGARLGYIVASEEIIRNLRNIKLGIDTCTNMFGQVIIAEWFKRGYFPAHRKKLCEIYRSRRDVMLNAIDRYFPEGTKHTVPDGGYYIWAELPDGLNATALKGEIAEKLNVCYGDGAIFFSEGNEPHMGENCMRLNFSGVDEDVIETYFHKLGDFFKSKLA